MVKWKKVEDKFGQSPPPSPLGATPDI